MPPSSTTDTGNGYKRRPLTLGKRGNAGAFTTCDGWGGCSSTEEGPLMKPQPPLGEGSIHKEPILELEGTVYEEGERSIPGKGNPNYRL